MSANSRKSNTVFWDFQGPILEHCQGLGATMNSAHNRYWLTDRNKRLEELSQGVMLFGSDRPPTAAHTCSDPPAAAPYSSNLAFLDIAYVDPLKMLREAVVLPVIRSRRRLSVQTCLAARPKIFLTEGIQKFAQRRGTLFTHDLLVISLLLSLMTTFWVLFDFTW